MDPFDTQVDNTPVDYAPPLPQKSGGRSNASKKKAQQQKSIFVTLPRALRKLWATRQTEDIDKVKEVSKYVKITMKELCIYAVFLVNLSICKLQSPLLTIIVESC